METTIQRPGRKKYRWEAPGGSRLSELLPDLQRLPEEGVLNLTEIQLQAATFRTGSSHARVHVIPLPIDFQ